MPRFLFVPLEALLPSWPADTAEATSDPVIVGVVGMPYAMRIGVKIGFSQNDSLGVDSLAQIHRDSL